MKKLLLLLIISFAIQVKAQTLPVGRLNKYATVFIEDTEPSISKVNYSTLVANISFTSITHEENGWIVGNLMSIGQSYIWAKGNGEWNSDTSVHVEQQFFYGFGYNIGIVPSNNSIDYGKTSFTFGGIIGWDKLGFFLGYDVVNSKEVIGISVNILGLPILQRLTKFTTLPE